MQQHGGEQAHPAFLFQIRRPKGHRQAMVGQALLKPVERRHGGGDQNRQEGRVENPLAVGMGRIIG